MEYLGMKILNRGSKKFINRDDYARINLNNSFKSGRKYTQAFAEKHAVLALINYDLNMEYFNELSRNKFVKAIDNFVKRYDFKSSYNISELKGKSGYYAMVLDDFKQIYVGTASDIESRIKKHWNKQRPFDRLVFGRVSDSKISIDSFRTFDTTRIYYKLDKDTFIHEDDYIKGIPKEFNCNRLSGGKLTKATKPKFRDLENKIYVDFKIVRDLENIELNEVQLHDIYSIYSKSLESNDTKFIAKEYVGKYGRYSLEINYITKEIRVKSSIRFSHSVYLENEPFRLNLYINISNFILSKPPMTNKERSKKHYYKNKSKNPSK